MKVLIGCEYSATVREAFARRGHDAWSCDLLPSDKPGKCKAHSDGRYWHDGSEKRRLRDASVEFFRTLLNWHEIPRRCLEQPMSRMSTLVGPFTQRIHPWQFGHPERKETWLWLRNLRPLRPTNPQVPFGQVCMPVREDSPDAPPPLGGPGAPPLQNLHGDSKGHGGAVGLSCRWLPPFPPKGKLQRVNPL